MCKTSVSNVTDKFSHGAASHTLNGQNVNVMLEFKTVVCILLGIVLCT